MKFSSAVFIAVAIAASSSCNGFQQPAFVAQNNMGARSCRSALMMSSRSSSSSKKGKKKLFMGSTPSESATVPVIITGNNIHITEALRSQVDRKMDRVLGKLAEGGAVQDCDVHLSVNKNPKVKNAHTAEVVTSVKGTVIRCAESSPDMYASIDAVTARLARKLRKYKERRIQGHHGGPNIGENMASLLESIDSIEDDSPAGDDEFIDPEAPQITKIKSYDLTKAISIQEAIFALDYIDHDFYVFRDAASGEVSVVYKRNGGRGVGLIQPEKKDTSNEEQPADGDLLQP